MVHSASVGIFVALAVTEAAAFVRNAAPKMTSLETSCYFEKDPAGESGGAKGRSYRGLVTSTASGRTCQKWTSNHPHKEASAIKASTDNEDGGTMAWGNGLGNHNYCRNPDSSMEKPWCYTTDPTEDHKKEACEIPKCPKNPRDFKEEAKSLATKVGSADCDCAAQLYGSTETTANTAVKFLQVEIVRMGKTKEGKPCRCN